MIDHTPTVRYAEATDIAPGRVELFRRVVTDPETGEQSVETSLRLYATREDGTLEKAGIVPLSALTGRMAGQATAIEQLLGRAIEHGAERVTGQAI